MHEIPGRRAETEITLGHLTPGERLRTWGDMLWRHIGGLRAEAFGNQEFDARLITTHAGYLSLCKIEASAHRVVRVPGQHGHEGRGHLKVVAQLRGRACFVQAGRETWLAPGQWSVYDTTRAYTVTNPGDVEQLVLMIPKERLPEALPFEAVTVPPLACQQGVARLAWETVLSLYQELPAMSDSSRERIADVVTELVHLSLMDHQGTVSELSQRQLLRDRIFGYVARHIRDARLDVAGIAKALNCSRSHLYNAFADEPDGVAGYILKQRIALFKAALTDPANSKCTLTELGYDCGFSRPSQISQLFRSQVGVSPSEYRAAQPAWFGSKSP